MLEPSGHACVEGRKPGKLGEIDDDTAVPRALQIYIYSFSAPLMDVAGGVARPAPLPPSVLDVLH
jgi:hypothetical protein